MRKALLAAVLVGWVGLAAAQGTAKPGVITVGFIPAEDSRAMVRQSQAILDIVAWDPAPNGEATELLPM